MEYGRGAEAAAQRHRPFLLQGNGDTAVLMIHGIFGSPVMFSEIAHMLHDEGCTVQAILLPGHGGTAADFARSGVSVWQQAVRQATEILRRTHRRVLLIGHSMGGLLCLDEAAQRDVGGIILLAVPTRVHVSGRSARMSLRILWGSPQKDDDFMNAYRASYSVGIGNMKEYFGWIPRMLDLIALMRGVCGHLERIRTPVLIIQSRRDESVRWQSAMDLQKGLVNAPVTLMLMRDSYHVHYHPEEKTAMMQAIRDFATDEGKTKIKN